MVARFLAQQVRAKKNYSHRKPSNGKNEKTRDRRVLPTRTKIIILNRRLI